jgi:hypothetical protein
MGWGGGVFSSPNGPRGELRGSTSKESLNPWRQNAQEMGSEGPPLSFRKWRVGVGVTGQLSESGWKEVSSARLLGGSLASLRPSGGLVAGDERRELASGGEEARSSCSVPLSSPVALSVGAAVVVNLRGSAGIQRDDQKHAEIKQTKNYHRLF